MRPGWVEGSWQKRADLIQNLKKKKKNNEIQESDRIDQMLYW